MNLESRSQLPIFCAFSDCKGSRESSLLSPKAGHLVRKGRYYRNEDSRWIPRFRCLDCKRTFSAARLLPTYRQKKRTINAMVGKIYHSGVSQNRAAIILNLNVKTIVRKFVFLAAQAKLEREEMCENLAKSSPNSLIKELQFDEMESFERSKCLPLSIPLAVVPKTRKILSFRVAQMPAKGLLSDISRKKYGRREDHRARAAASMFSEIAPLLHPEVCITTDQNPKYPGWIKAHFPKAKHRAVKGKRGCIVGQGELKKTRFDPLFDLNHTAAMLRANINRLFRRTWCTSKRPDRLAAHIELYIQFHNSVLTQAADHELIPA